VTQFFHSLHFFTDFIHGQFFAHSIAGAMKTAVNTTVDTIAAQIKRGKHNNPFAIDLLLDFQCCRKHFLQELFIF
jgi:hypothetical protein